jgi:hypothetical protein
MKIALKKRNSGEAYSWDIIRSSEPEAQNARVYQAKIANDADGELISVKQGEDATTRRDNQKRRARQPNKPKRELAKRRDR